MYIYINYIEHCLELLLGPFCERIYGGSQNITLSKVQRKINNRLFFFLKATDGFLIRFYDVTRLPDTFAVVSMVSRRDYHVTYSPIDARRNATRDVFCPGQIIWLSTV